MGSAVRSFHLLIGKFLDQYCRWFSRPVIVPPNVALSPALGTYQVAQGDYEPSVTVQHEPATEIGIADDHNLESPAESGGLGGVDADPHVNPPYNFDWRSMVIGICLTSAVEIALQSLQPHIKIPLLVHLLSLALVFAFSSFFVSGFFSTDHPRFSHALVQVGKLSVFLAFFLAITVPFSLFFKIILWSICVLSLLAIAYVVAASGRLRPCINFFTGVQNV